MTAPLIEVEAADMIEGFRAQRAEALDKAVEWFARYMAEKRRADDLQKKLGEMEHS